MSLPNACRDARARLPEALAATPPTPDPELQAHLAACPDCCQEYLDLVATLEGLQTSAMAIPGPTPDVRPDLWTTIESRLDAHPQVAPPERQPRPEKWLLVTRYAYLLTLGGCIWYSLLLGQPWFLDGAQALGLVLPEGVITEYGLFLAFLLVGAFAAVVAIPILVPPGRETGPGTADGRPTLVGSLTRFFARFHARIRFFAC